MLRYILHILCVIVEIELRVSIVQLIVEELGQWQLLVAKHTPLNRLLIYLLI